MWNSKVHDTPKATSQHSTSYLACGWTLSSKLCIPELDQRADTVKLPSLMSLKLHLLHFDLSFRKKKHGIKNDINNTFAVCQV